MSTTRKTIWLLAFLGISVFAAVAWVAGCGRKPDENQAVALVGNHKIPLKQVLDRYPPGTPFASAEEELNQKKALVQGLVEQVLLAEAGHRAGYDTLPEIVQQFEQEKDRTLIDALYETEVRKPVNVTEKDVKDWYDHLTEERRVSLIQVATQATAESLYQEIKKGKDFATLALERSLDRNSNVKGGDIGFVQWGTIAQPLQEQVFSQGVGEVSRPVAVQKFWYLVKVVEKRPFPRPDYGSARASLRQQLVAQRETDRANVFLDQLRTESAIVVDTAVAHEANRKLRELEHGESPTGPVLRTFLDLSKVPASLGERPLAWCSGETLSVLKAYQALQGIMPLSRPHLETEAQIKEIAFQIFLPQLLQAQARARELDRSARYREMLADLKDNLVAGVMRQKLIDAVHFTDAEVRASYESRKPQYTQPAEFHLREIQLADSAEAVSLKKQIRSPEDFARFASAKTLRPGYREKGGDIGYVRRESAPLFFAVVEKLAVNQVSSPVKNPDGTYSLLLLVERFPQKITPFDSVAHGIADTLLAERSRKLLDDWVAERQKTTKVTIDEDLLKKTIDYKWYAKKKESPPVAG